MTLRRAYLARAAQAHPDTSGLSEDDAARASAELNQAKETLEDPERRALVLLAMRLKEAGMSLAPEDDRAMPPGFLAEMMNAREEMESTRMVNDTDALEAWRAWGEARQREHHLRVRALFEALDSALDLSTFRALKLELNAWRYVERMLEQMD